MKALIFKLETYAVLLLLNMKTCITLHPRVLGQQEPIVQYLKPKMNDQQRVLLEGKDSSFHNEVPRLKSSKSQKNESIISEEPPAEELPVAEALRRRKDPLELISVMELQNRRKSQFKYPLFGAKQRKDFRTPGGRKTRRKNSRKKTSNRFLSKAPLIYTLRRAHDHSLTAASQPTQEDGEEDNISRLTTTLKPAKKSILPFKKESFFLEKWHSKFGKLFSQNERDNLLQKILNNNATLSENDGKNNHFSTFNNPFTIDFNNLSSLHDLTSFHFKTIKRKKSDGNTLALTTTKMKTESSTFTSSTTPLERNSNDYEDAMRKEDLTQNEQLTAESKQHTEKTILKPNIFRSRPTAGFNPVITELPIFSAPEYESTEYSKDKCTEEEDRKVPLAVNEHNQMNTLRGNTNNNRVKPEIIFGKYFNDGTDNGVRNYHGSVERPSLQSSETFNRPLVNKDIINPSSKQPYLTKTRAQNSKKISTKQPSGLYPYASPLRRPTTRVKFLYKNIPNYVQKREPYYAPSYLRNPQKYPKYYPRFYLGKPYGPNRRNDKRLSVKTATNEALTISGLALAGALTGYFLFSSATPFFKSREEMNPVKAMVKGARNGLFKLLDAIDEYENNFKNREELKEKHPESLVSLSEEEKKKLNKVYEEKIEENNKNISKILDTFFQRMTIALKSEGFKVNLSNKENITEGFNKVHMAYDNGQPENANQLPDSFRDNITKYQAENPLENPNNISSKHQNDQIITDEDPANLLPIFNETNHLEEENVVEKTVVSSSLNFVKDDKTEKKELVVKIPKKFKQEKMKMANYHNLTKTLFKNDQNLTSSFNNFGLYIPPYIHSANLVPQNNEEATRYVKMVINNEEKLLPYYDKREQRKESVAPELTTFTTNLQENHFREGPKVDKTTTEKENSNSQLKKIIINNKEHLVREVDLLSKNSRKRMGKAEDRSSSYITPLTNGIIIENQIHVPASS